MATTKKIIGKVPVYRGDWQSGVIYYKHNMVSWLGSLFISLVDNNTQQPAIFDKGNYMVHSSWSFAADGSYSYVEKQSKKLIPQEEFDAMREAGELETWRTYHTYEE